MHGGVCWGLWAPLTCTLLLKHPNTQISQAKQSRQIYANPAAAEHRDYGKSAILDKKELCYLGGVTLGFEVKLV